MTDPILSDDAMRTAMLALDGLAKRQEIVGRNLANVDTPGYRAQTINFEATLKRAAGEQSAMALTATQPGHISSPEQETAMLLTNRIGGSVRADGNNVDIDLEMNQMAETGIRYQAITELVNSKFQLLKSLAVSR